MTVTALVKLIREFHEDHKFLPKILHINCDNCGRENKACFLELKLYISFICQNMFVFAFLYQLVELNIFEEIHMSFLLGSLKII